QELAVRREDGVVVLAHGEGDPPLAGAVSVHDEAVLLVGLQDAGPGDLRVVGTPGRLDVLERAGGQLADVGAVHVHGEDVQVAGAGRRPGDPAAVVREDRLHVEAAAERQPADVAAVDVHQVQVPVVGVGAVGREGDLPAVGGDGGVVVGQ